MRRVKSDIFITKTLFLFLKSHWALDTFDWKKYKCWEAFVQISTTCLRLNETKKILLIFYFNFMQRTQQTIYELSQWDHVVFSVPFPVTSHSQASLESKLERAMAKACMAERGDLRVENGSCYQVVLLYMWVLGFIY